MCSSFKKLSLSKAHFPACVLRSIEEIKKCRIFAKIALADNPDKFYWNELVTIFSLCG